jgi:hypothetical protein
MPRAVVAGGPGIKRVHSYPHALNCLSETLVGRAYAFLEVAGHSLFGCVPTRAACGHQLPQNGALAQACTFTEPQGPHSSRPVNFPCVPPGCLARRVRTWGCRLLGVDVLPRRCALPCPDSSFGRSSAAGAWRGLVAAGCSCRCTFASPAATRPCRPVPPATAV